MKRISSNKILPSISSLLDLMQIDTDLSPVVSPSSNISNSFASQRDILLFGLNSNHAHKFPSETLGSNPQSIKGETTINKIGSEPYCPTPNNQNHTVTTTNESYSVEKYNYFETLNRENFPANSSAGFIIPENSTERELQPEEEPTKSQIQTMHILEYEEFVPGNESSFKPYRRASDRILNEKSKEKIEKEALQAKLGEAPYYSERPQRVSGASEEVFYQSVTNGVTTVTASQNTEVSFQGPGKKKKLELQCKRKSLSEFY